MTRLTCYECGAPATHEALGMGPRRRYLCRHGAMVRDKALVRPLTLADYGLTKADVKARVEAVSQ